MIDRGKQEVRSQLIELKRQLASAIVDEQRLYQRYSEASREAEMWRGRAKLALGRGSEQLARAALERSRSRQVMAAEFRKQYLDQKIHVEWMKSRLLEGQARPAPRSTRLEPPVERLDRDMAWLERWESKAAEDRARLAAWAELERDEVAERFEALERESEIDQQLNELKQRLGRA